MTSIDLVYLLTGAVVGLLVGQLVNALRYRKEYFPSSGCTQDDSGDKSEIGNQNDENGGDCFQVRDTDRGALQDTPQSLEETEHDPLSKKL